MNRDIICYGCLTAPKPPIISDDGLIIHGSTLSLLRTLAVEGIYFSLVQAKTNHYSLNIYGPRKDSYFVAYQLQDANVSLQHPQFVTRGIAYCNAQWPFHADKIMADNYYVTGDGWEIRFWSATEILNLKRGGILRKVFSALLKQMYESFETQKP